MKKGDLQELRDLVRSRDQELLLMDIKLEGKEQTISLLYNLLTSFAKGEKDE